MMQKKAQVAVDPWERIWPLGVKNICSPLCSLKQ
jgi:hypothetical protein